MRGRPGKTPSVDIGILQVNIRYHPGAFSEGLASMLDPAWQVDYVARTLVPKLLADCGSAGWTGCYHAPTAPRRAQTYATQVNALAGSLARALRKKYE